MVESTSILMKGGGRNIDATDKHLILEGKNMFRFLAAKRCRITVDNNENEGDDREKI